MSFHFSNPVDAQKIDAAALADLGEGQLAYVKKMRSDEVQKLYQGVPDLEPGLHLFALLGADGQPILLADSREVAVASALANDLEPLAVH